MTPEPVWEIVTTAADAPHTTRLPVPGGWLYVTGYVKPTVCFVPRPPERFNHGTPLTDEGEAI
jgi:hypothetical protein